MSLAKIFKQLDQRCAWHPRVPARVRFCHTEGRFVADQEPMFKPSEGKFIKDRHKGTIFVCFECLRKQKRVSSKVETAKYSSYEFDVFTHFSKKGIVCYPEYKVDKWPFDFGFPDCKLLLEVDDSSHDTPKGKARDKFKDDCAAEMGWTVIRVKAGPGPDPELPNRCVSALERYKEERAIVVR